MTLEFVILLVSAFLTATLSGIVGMGGGILLLAILFSFLPHGAAIPIHAIVQIASNSTRVLAFAGHADRQAIGRFAIGALPGSIVGTLLLWSFGRLGEAEPYLKIVVGLYVLVAPYVRLAGPKADADQTWGFTLIGALAGVMALTVGAVGPLIAPIFARRDYVKERLIATKASCQMVTHVIKLPAFALLGTFTLGRLWTYALPMALMVIPGTFLGKFLLRYVSASAFRWTYRAALLVAGAKVLVIDGILQLL